MKAMALTIPYFAPPAKSRAAIGPCYARRRDSARPAARALGRGLTRWTRIAPSSPSAISARSCRGPCRGTCSRASCSRPDDRQLEEPRAESLHRGPGRRASGRARRAEPGRALARGRRRHRRDRADRGPYLRCRPLRAEHDARRVERRRRLLSGAPARSRARAHPRHSRGALDQSRHRVQLRRSRANRAATVGGPAAPAARRTDALGDLVSLPVVEVVAAVIERDGKILIARRRAGTHLAGLWEFPGGKREPGETLEEALGRELVEELATPGIVGEVIETVGWAYPDKRVQLHFFWCHLKDEPRPLEGQEIAWVERADLPRYEFPAADAALIERLRGD